MDFNEPTNLAYVQGQVFALQHAVQALLRELPDPGRAWLGMAEYLDEWAEQNIDAAADLPPQMVAGVRDTLAQLSISAPRPAS